MVLEEKRYHIRNRIAHLRNKRPIYEIQPDGSVKLSFESPTSTEARAYDLSQNADHQVFMRGYANPVKIHVDDVETGEVKLMPSERYQQYMEQKIISDAVQGGSLSGQKLMWMTAGNMIMTVVAIIIIVSVIA